MKIVFLSDDFPPQSFGGAGISTYDLALGMKKAGQEVFVITTCRRKEEAGELEYQGFKIFKIASNYPGRWRSYLSLYNPSVIHDLEKLLKKIKPDVVHVNNVHFYLSYHSIKLSKRYAKAVVFTARDAMSFSFGKLVTKRYLETQNAHMNWLDHLKQAKKRWNPVRNLIIRYYLGFADQVFAVSEALKKALEQNGIDNVKVLHTGLNISDWQATDNEITLFKKRFPSLKGKRIVFFGGRLSNAKGSDVTHQAMAEVQKEIPEAFLFTAGGSEYWINRDEMRMAYAATDLVIVPSVCFDAFPRTVLEAMASGKPVIGTCYGGAREAIVNSVTGYIVNPFNASLMAEKIIDLLSNPEKAHQFGKAGYERVKTSFNLENKIGELLVAYETLLKKKTTLKSTALVIFGKDFPIGRVLGRKFDTIVATKMLQKNIKTLGYQFVELETLIGPGSIHEASAFAEELSRLKLPDGSSLPKSFTYKGYELWWIHYNGLFSYFCLPYMQYKKLLDYLKSFHNVYFYQPPNKSLFSCYLKAHRCEMSILRKPGFRSLPFPPFGILLQILLTLLSLPVLMMRNRRLMVFIGDKFEKSQDYDFRMKFVYQELRQRKIPFVEFIRSLESWKIVLQHAIKRRRPIIYSEAVALIGKFISIISGGRAHAKRQFNANVFAKKLNPEAWFKLMVASQYILGVYGDIWTIRIMKYILRLTGIKAAFITAANERNFHSVLGCKLNAIPTIGILHGIASRHYNGYDFLPGFDGEKMLSVDKYGLWSEWWKEYYLKYSKAYKSEQLFVSGPMRPLQSQTTDFSNASSSNQQKINVLLVSEIVAIPIEVLPYLNALINAEDFSVHIKFRAHQDSFEAWLKSNHPEILSKFSEDRIFKGSMQEAIALCDVVVGSQSTGVIEATLQQKPFVLFNTPKWGDYYSMTESDKTRCFFAENPEELIEKIKNAQSVSLGTLEDLREQYFGDPHKNGSAWVVDRIEELLL